LWISIVVACGSKRIRNPHSAIRNRAARHFHQRFRRRSHVGFGGKWAEAQPARPGQVGADGLMGQRGAAHTGPGQQAEVGLEHLRRGAWALESVDVDAEHAGAVRHVARANADVACQTHIVRHAVSIAKFLGRKVNYDPAKNKFIGDRKANRLRCEALREPWRI
jgi:hypothetical protein